jgi:hypothetical protein
MAQTLAQIALSRTKRLNVLPFLRDNKISAINTYYYKSSDPNKEDFTGCQFISRKTGKKSIKVLHQDIFNTMDGQAFNDYISKQSYIQELLKK